MSSASWLASSVPSKQQCQYRTQGIVPEVILRLDGNPLGFDAREINVVKGGCALRFHCGPLRSSLVERDALMVEYDQVYPGYDLASSKGYGRQCCASSRYRGEGLTPFIVLRIARTLHRSIRFRVTSRTPNS